MSPRCAACVCMHSRQQPVRPGASAGAGRAGELSSFLVETAPVCQPAGCGTHGAGQGASGARLLFAGVVWAVARTEPRLEPRASSIEHRAHARHLSCHGDGQMVVERSTSRERRVQQPTPRQPRARPPARATPCPPRCCAPLPRGRHSGAPPQWPCPWRAPPPRAAVCRERPPPPARRPRLAPPRRPCPSWSTTCGERWGR